MGKSRSINGIELYSDNAQHAASMISRHGWSLDHVAHEIEEDAKRSAVPYRKSTTDSYVDHFGVTKQLYTGRQRDPQHPVYDRIVYNDDPAAHIIELGIVQNVLQFRDGREQRVTELQRGHFFLVGAAAKAVSISGGRRPVPAPRRSGWDDRTANAYVDTTGASGGRHSTAAQAAAVRKKG
jgi:hypothetical protein